LAENKGDTTMMFDIAGGIILAVIGLNLISLALGLTILSFQSKVWAIIGLWLAAWLLVTFFGDAGALIDFGVVAFWIYSNRVAIKGRWQAQRQAKRQARQAKSAKWERAGVAAAAWVRRAPAPAPAPAPVRSTALVLYVPPPVRSAPRALDPWAVWVGGVAGLLLLVFLGEAQATLSLQARAATCGRLARRESPSA
jgi:hypothetical protein